MPCMHAFIIKESPSLTGLSAWRSHRDPPQSTVAREGFIHGTTGKLLQLSCTDIPGEKAKAERPR